MPDQLEDPQDAHHPNEPNDLSGLPDDLDVLEAVEEERQVEGDDGQEVDQVHRLLEELPLPRRAQKPDNVFLSGKKFLIKTCPGGRFCRTGLPLARPSWAPSAFSSHCPFSSHQRS